MTSFQKGSIDVYIVVRMAVSLIVSVKHSEAWTASIKTRGESDTELNARDR